MRYKLVKKRLTLKTSTLVTTTMLWGKHLPVITRTHHDKNQPERHPLSSSPCRSFLLLPTNLRGSFPMATCRRCSQVLSATFRGSITSENEFPPPITISWTWIGQESVRES